MNFFGYEDRESNLFKFIVKKMISRYLGKKQIANSGGTGNFLIALNKPFYFNADVYLCIFLSQVPA